MLNKAPKLFIDIIGLLELKVEADIQKIEKSKKNCNYKGAKEKPVCCKKQITARRPPFHPRNFPRYSPGLMPIIRLKISP
jgi:hypothetical protein